MSYMKPEIQAKTAGADLSALQYTQVKFGADKTLVVGAGAGEVAIGILMNAPKSGEVAEVAMAGGALLKMSAAVAIGASVGVASGGKGVTGAAAAVCLCRAMEAAAANNDVVEVIIDRHTVPA